ncbi:MAG: hypothetical protein KAR42_04795 [candidate division Zixibacteria bacterium]|nr:hypothetical protein [candidate division Zixibacteria bacterium]
MISDAETEGLPSNKDISNGYRAEVKIKGVFTPPWNQKLFAWRFFSRSDYLIEASTSFEGQIVADLGCGSHLDSHILLDVVGARGHIAIEPYNMHSFYERLIESSEAKGKEELNSKIRKMQVYIGHLKMYDQNRVNRLVVGMKRHLNHGTGDLPVSLVAEDMLTALRRLPNESVSILASGIDECIVPKDVYAEKVEKEISRVLNPKGAFIGESSRFRPAKLMQDNRWNHDSTFSKYVKLKELV